MNVIMYQTLLFIMIHFGFLVEVENIETAFLYIDLEEKIHMEHPPGMREVTKDNCIILEKSICGLMQAAS